MSSSEATVIPPARRSASAATPGASLAGLIGVLDRADGVAVPQRSRPVHTSALRSSVRAVPLRSVPMAPPARPARTAAVAGTRGPTVTVVPDRERRPLTGLRDLTRRVALWGAGAQGEYLAWRTPEPAPGLPLRPRLRALTRRIALWGAGPRGEYLAWGGPTPSPSPTPVPVPRQVPRRVDPPVVLRELPSTPTIRPAASSPAVALIPAPTVPAPRPGPTVLRAATTVPVAAARLPMPARPVPAAGPEPAGPVRAGWAPPPPGWPQPPAWHTRRRVTAPVARTTVIPPLPAGPRRTAPPVRAPSAGARAGPARARGDPTTSASPRAAFAASG
ncbi:hypothetical protein [Blastococcus goldschmidtiae]|uniref:Uncharacterized protein n=1 Tax=Blastococcus goldschmidtiae TaxID=3075546 RepID=A0ABU2K219_9ACTN|nr:hypothetical protein [Blastococcus sp. DSM 46792]MDT0274335.1 hypothetical protein [Blastococcus sp. DSM 46792]